MITLGLLFRTGQVCPHDAATVRRHFVSGAGVNLDALITGSEAARLAGVSKQLVRRWRKLGHLTPADSTPGRPRFRVRDVLTAERETRRSPRSRRAA